MIKRYEQYLKEEINWRKLNPFKRNKHYKSIPYDPNNIDPYGEEDWNDGNIILQIAKNQNNPYDKITNLSYDNMELSDLNGIENFINLRRLIVNNNRLTSLKDIENLFELTEIYCESNLLTSLKGIENSKKLITLYCRYNQLKSLEEIENLVELRILACSDNHLYSLDLTNLVDIRYLHCYRNKLTELKGIENLTKLVQLNCFENEFPTEYRLYLRKYCKEKNIDLTI